MSQRFGRYVVVRPLGAGAFGEVFLAHDPDLAREVAVKVVGGERVGQDSLELLLREARAIAALHHPNLVGVFDVGTEPGRVWVVMEYVPGETLRRRMDQGPRPLPEVVALGRDLCGALALAHARGVVHRDLKPENVLLTPEGTPKLADFGMARAPGSRTLTDSGAIVGTLMYMSPEQAMGERVDGRSDLFSLAVVLYEAFTGSHPFLREGEVATLFAILNENPSPPAEGRAALGAREQAFFRRALAKDAAARHPDAAAFAEDLALLLAASAGDEGAALEAEATDPTARYESKLVGRGAELERLTRRLERLRAGEGGAVLLAGEAGIGKSRLLTELARIAERQRIRVLKGRALLEGGPAYHPWSQILTQALPGGSRAEALEGFLARHPELSGAREASLRRLLHLGASESEDVSGPDRIWEATAAALQALSSERPLLVLLDDLHWADLSSLQLFRFAAAHARGQRWLLLGAYRPEESEGESAPVTVGEVSRIMGREEDVETLRLGRLSPEDTAAMVENLLRREIAVPALEQRIYRETEGNPLFVLETARLIDETGGRPEDFVIPPRVVDVVEHRLDRLSGSERDALEVAAVEGEFFHVAPIAAVLELPRIRALKLLQNLERNHRIVRPAEQRFRFDHGKIREVILSRLGAALRREYHRVVATCLIEEANGASSAELAHHLGEAGDPAAALPHRLAAAREARAMFANDEALRHLHVALAALEGPRAVGDVGRQRIEIQLGIGEILLLTGNYAAAAESFQSVASDAAAPGHPALRCRAVLGEGECDFALARYEQAREKLEQARRLAEAADERSLLTRIHVATARVHTRRGEFEEALAACGRSEEIARGLGDDRLRVHSLLESGDVCLRRGAFDQARGHFEAALAIAGRAEDLAGQARSLSSLATVARQTGDFPAALRHLEKSGALSRRIGDPQGEARALANRGNVHLNRGEWGPARECYEPALRSFRALGERHAEGVVLNNMCVALSAGGDYEAAARVAEECLALTRELGDRWEMAGALDNLGVLEHRRGRSVVARRVFGEVVALRRTLGDQAGLVDSLLSLAVVEESLADPEAARSCVREATALADPESEAASVARGLAVLCEGGAGEALREGAETLLAAARKARERGDAELEAARTIPAGELLARLGDAAALESLAREQMERSAALHMVYEEAWARLLAARASLGAGRREEAHRFAAEALDLAARSDLRGVRWKAALWLAEAFGEAEPALIDRAGESLERYVETFGAEDRARYLSAPAVREPIERLIARASAAGNEAAARRLLGALEAPAAG